MRVGEAGVNSDAPPLDPLNYLGMVETIAKRWGRRLPHLADEFESEAPVAMCAALATYDPDGGCAPESHIWIRTWGAMQDVARSSIPFGYRRQRHQAPAIESISWKVDGDRTYDGPRPLFVDIEHPSDDLPVGWEAESIEEIGRLTRHLTPQGRKLILAMYAQAGLDGPDVLSGYMGVGKQRISQIYWEAIDTLRRVCNSPVTGHARRRPHTKDHCPNGHEYTPGNTVHRSNGEGRACLECKRVTSRKAHRKYTDRLRREAQIACSGTP